MNYERSAKIFKALAHTFRLRLLRLLSADGGYVCHLVEATGRRQAYVSQHLQVLRAAGLVNDRREGMYVSYQICDPALAGVLDLAAAIAGGPTIIEVSPDVWLRDTQPVCCARRRRTRSKGWSNVNGNNFLKPWHGIPREEIDWHPTVVAERCVGCGLCVTSCGRQVFAFDYLGNRPVVVNPLNCMVGCSTCGTVCTQDALEFPSQGFIRQIVRERKLLRRSKDELRANREQYDVRLREPTAVQVAKPSAKAEESMI